MHHDALVPPLLRRVRRGELMQFAVPPRFIARHFAAIAVLLSVAAYAGAGWASCLFQLGSL
jgi:hypothetical protein